MTSLSYLFIVHLRSVFKHIAHEEDSYRREKTEIERFRSL